MDELLEILQDLHPEVDFSLEGALMDDGILDSFDFITIISEISDAFDVVIHGQEINPENFNSVEAMWELISTKLSEG